MEDVEWHRTASAFEIGQNDQRGVMGLTVKFGRGGHLSFALDDAMANSLFEMLGVLTGRATPKHEKLVELKWRAATAKVERSSS